MKEKLVKFLASKWLGLIVGTVVTVIIMWQEKALGDMTNAWLLGLSTSVIVGLLVEIVRFILCINKFNAKNLLPYLGGSILGIIIMYIV